MTHLDLDFFNELQIMLKSLDLNVDDVKGHCCDNGSNMKGKSPGVQKWFLAHHINRK